MSPLRQRTFARRASSRAALVDGARQSVSPSVSGGPGLPKVAPRWGLRSLTAPVNPSTRQPCPQSGAGSRRTARGGPSTRASTRERGRAEHVAHVLPTLCGLGCRPLAEVRQPGPTSFVLTDRSVDAQLAANRICCGLRCSAWRVGGWQGGAKKNAAVGSASSICYTRARRRGVCTRCRGRALRACSDPLGPD